MKIFPAIDIRNGQVVRLQQGKSEKRKIFFAHPWEAAEFWVNEGAEYLHIVDLDGAFGDREPNADAIAQIVAKVKIPVQIGGGIRSLQVCSDYLDAGAARLIIGTIALENQKLFHDMCKHFPGKIGVSLDAENGVLKTRGWVQDSGITLEDAVRKMEDAEAAFIIYTDIARDGMQKGINLPGLARLLSLTSLPVIGAGGINSFADVQNCWEIGKNGNLEAIISGKALYEKTLNLQEAMEWIKNQER